MEIYPALDLYEGKVVRLERGNYEKRKIYSSDPKAVARRWFEEGARWLHVVDLEGARSGGVKNWEALKQILSEKGVSVQFGGGVRRVEDVEQLLQLGVKRVILGTKVLEPGFLKQISKAYGPQIALSLDLKGEEVHVEGWLRSGGKSVFDLLEELKEVSVACVIITDIERDGTLTGINLPKFQRLLGKSSLPVILSGGITSLEDIRSLVSLKTKRLDGMIIGKALYEGTLDLKEALSLVPERRNSIR